MVTALALPIPFRIVSGSVQFVKTSNAATVPAVTPSGSFAIRKLISIAINKRIQIIICVFIELTSCYLI